MATSDTIVIGAPEGETASDPADESTVVAVLVALSVSHLLNDLMQSLVPAVYPILKTKYDLTFTQVGLITLVFQCTASLLQPLVGMATDHRPRPYSLAIGMVFTLDGLVLLAIARSYPFILAASAFVGIGSAVFHPEASRLARLASGGKHGLAQSLFQVGGNAGSAIGPLAAAIFVVRYGQPSLRVFALLALISVTILWNVGVWYKHHGLARLKAGAKGREEHPPLPRGKAAVGLGILVALIFSKFVYLASITSYFTFYLIHQFGASVQTAQLHLFLFLAAVAVGTILGGPLGDKLGRKTVIWFSILGALPFTLLLPHVDLFWTGPLAIVIGLILASAFPAIVVFAQELAPGNVGMVAGLCFGLSFGLGGIGAAVLGHVADLKGIAFVYQLCAFLPAIGLLAAFLPKVEKPAH